MTTTHHLICTKQQHYLKFLTASPALQKSSISKAEAEVLINKISTSASNVFKHVVLLVKSKGYVALGYSKPADCLRKKLPDFSNSYICRLLLAADTYLMLDHELEHINKVSEATFRPLQNISTDDIERIWQQTLIDNNVSKLSRLTSKYIKRAMEKLGIAAEITHKAVPLTLDSKLQRTVDGHVKIIVNDIIAPYANSVAEWKQYANIVHKQVLSACPMNH
jgi:hypothetical protein